jgi:hypothetical protein
MRRALMRGGRQCTVLEAVMALAHILTASLFAPVALSLASGAVAAAQPGTAGLETAAPGIALWTNHDDEVFARGDAMTVYLRTDVDAFVSVFHVDADGIVRVLFPVRRSTTPSRPRGASLPFRARTPTTRCASTSTRARAFCSAW